DHAGNDPYEQQQAGSVDFADDVSGDDEDAGADHGPHDEGRGVEPRNGPDEFGARGLRGGHGASNLVALSVDRYLSAPPFLGTPCASCLATKSSLTCSPMSPTATRKLRNTCATCLRPLPTGARRSSRRSSGWSTRRTRSRTRW